MDKALRIYFVIAAVFVVVGGLIIYDNWSTERKHEREVHFLDSNDPLLIRAKQRALDTMDTLFKLYPKYPNQSFVKFPFTEPGGEMQHRWGLLRDLQKDHVSVVLKEPGAGNTGVVVDKEFQVPMEQVEDWLVDIDSGKVRGGFTTQALLQLHPGMDEKSADQQLKLFVDPIK